MDVGRNSVYVHGFNESLTQDLAASNGGGAGISNEGANISLVELGKRLLSACQEGEDDEVRDLMSKGAPFTTDWLGTSPLHLSALNGHLGTVKVLLRAGISRDARTKVDKTPLHFAAQDGHTEIVEALLKHGADVDALDMLHMTPLHWAVERGNVSTVEMILRYGGSTNIESKFDKTPLEIASDNGRPDIFEMLQNAQQFRNFAMDQAESDAATMAATRSIMLDDPQDEDPLPSPTHEAVPAASQQEVVATGRNDTQNEALKLLEAQGITLLPEDPGGLTLNDGQSIELTEAGKLAFGIQSTAITPVSTAPKLVTTSTTKPTTITVSNVVKRKIAVTPVANNNRPTITKVVSLKSAPIGVSRTISSASISGLGNTTLTSKPTKTRVITLTPQQFAAIKSNNVSSISNIITGDKRKLPSVTTTSINTTGITSSVSSLNSDTRKIRIVPIKINSSSSVSNSSSFKPQIVSAIPKTLTTRVLSESESLKRQLEEARKAAESYKEELRKKEEEANRLKEQLESLYGNTQQQHC
ncbi:uncharacterized protein [Lepeophtheirus salmonis]|uniref:Uncharacterized protein n=2 Tax=Lepeophtheirus salmonis TaxID=72036 RepID=A0A0K2TFQ8_LEPSM|nr:GA-binding protein subunit beta-1-like [Lepeophtheirus salmonis]